jgi:hypothetical protein
MLMSPVCDKRLDRWTPYQASLLVPLWLHAAAWGILPSTSAWAGTSLVVFATGMVVYFAFTAMTVSNPRTLEALLAFAKESPSGVVSMTDADRM